MNPFEARDIWPPGTVIERKYVIDATLGRGSFGTAYRAHHRVLSRIYVIKRLHSQFAEDPDYVQKFIQEARAVERLRGCRQIVEIYDMTQTEDGHLILVMENMEGGDLEHFLSRRGKLPIGDAVWYGSQIAEGLAAAHAAGLVHRDVKPENVLLGADPRDAKLTDFGLVAERDNASPTSVLRGGSIGYAAPEQWHLAGKYLDGRADLYALGVTMYRMIAGHMPFPEADIGQWIDRVRSSRPAPLRAIRPETPPALERLIQDLLEADRDNRPASVLAVLERLRALGFPPMAEQAPGSGQPRPSQPGGTVIASFVAGAHQSPVPAPPSPAPAYVPPPSPQYGHSQYGPGWVQPPPSPSAYQQQPPPQATYGQSIQQPPLQPPSYPPSPQYGQSNLQPPQQPYPTPSYYQPGTPMPLAAAPAIAIPRRRGNLVWIGLLAVAAIAGGGWWYSEHRPPKRNPKDDLLYVWIPAGKFTMGCSPGSSDCLANEKPPHDVNISKGFYLSRTETTVEAYSRFASAARIALPDPPSWRGRSMNPGWKSVESPMTQVSWDESARYCEWIGGRLPTEAEWEYAARAGSTGVRYGAIGDSAWFGDNSGVRPIDTAEILRTDGTHYEDRVMSNLANFHPVAQKSPNAFGLFDMIGNVWEWTADYYGDKYYEASAATDPRGPGSGTNRVGRGGSFFIPETRASSSARSSQPPTSKNEGFGFRCAWDAALF